MRESTIQKYTTVLGLMAGRVNITAKEISKITKECQIANGIESYMTQTGHLKRIAHGLYSVRFSTVTNRDVKDVASAVSNAANNSKNKAKQKLVNIKPQAIKSGEPQFNLNDDQIEVLADSFANAQFSLLENLHTEWILSHAFQVGMKQYRDLINAIQK